LYIFVFVTAPTSSNFSDFSDFSLIYTSATRCLQ
jgi:hypothetical protein